MRTMWALALAGLLGLSLLGTGGASAQAPRGRPYSCAADRPQLSPYPKRIRGGDISANYFLGTRPEIQRRTDAREFRGAITDLDVRTAPVLDTGTTVVGFDNKGTFFNN